ncbi:MAG: cobalamin B12-binding domain-containing protein [Chloroflexi bacterium]|nr:cobalamin B12-binding domain-containing protein [Chloroflexota bacterium]
MTPAAMTPRERIRTTVAHREPDQVPVILTCAPPVLHEFSGVPAQDYFGSKEKQLEVKLDFQRRFPGALFVEFAPTWRKHPFVSAVEDTILTGNHQVPDFKADPRCLEFFDWWRYNHQHMDADIAARWGSFSWMARAWHPLMVLEEHLGGLGPLFLKMSQDRAYIHEVSKVLTEATVAWVQVQEEFCRGEGFRFDILFSATEMMPMLSEAWAEEFVAPHCRRIFGATSACIKLLHADMDVAHIAHVFPSWGCNAFDFNFASALALKKVIGDRISLHGNVNAVEVLADGTPALVEQACRDLIYRAGHGGGFILKTGGGLSVGTPRENIDAMIAAAEKYGRYPLPVPPPALEDEPVDKGHTRGLVKTYAIQSTGMLGDIASAVFDGDAARTRELVRQALPHFPPQRILGDGLAEGVRVMAEKHHIRETFFPELVMADRAFGEGLEVLLPYFTDRDFYGRIVIGSVRPNIHEMGIKVVGAMLRSAGFAVHSIGVNKTAEDFIKAAQEYRADVLAVGVYTREGLSTARRVSSLIKEQGLPYKTLTGGRGISPAKARECGLDLYGEDAVEAIEKAHALVGR